MIPNSGGLTEEVPADSYCQTGTTKGMYGGVPTTWHALRVSIAEKECNPICFHAVIFIALAFVVYAIRS